MKKCTKCKTPKDFNCFYKEKKSKDGLRSWCKECDKKRGHSRYLKNKDHCLEMNKKWRLRNPDKSYAISKKQTLKYPDKRKARKAVYYAVKVGKLIKPDICSHCFKKRKVESHHEDYSKPLEVKWLCKKCHTSWEQAKQRFPSFFKNHRLSKEEKEKLLVALKRATEETVFLMYHDPLNCIPERNSNNANDQTTTH